MEILKFYDVVKPLGKSKPERLPMSITVKEHFDKFYLLDRVDVWTEDGWLVTSVAEDGVTHQLRKGDQCVMARLGSDEMLYCNHHHLMLEQAALEQAV